MTVSSAKKGEDDCLYLLLDTGVLFLQIRQALDGLLNQMKNLHV